MYTINPVISSESCPSSNHNQNSSSPTPVDHVHNDSRPNDAVGNVAGGTDMIMSLCAQLPPILHVDDPEPLNLQNFREALASWNAGDLKSVAIQRFEDYLSGRIAYLDLSNLRLKTLPDAILQIPNLEVISLAANQFSEFPSHLKLLEDLKLINLSSNGLTDLQDSMKSFKKLEILILADNNLREIPEYLGHLEHLIRLDLSDNPLEDERLPQTLWLITQVELGRYLDQQEHIMPVPFEAFSEAFAREWPSFEKETEAQYFKTWLFKLAAILLAGRIPHQRAYFSQRLSCLLDAMTNHSGLRQRCFACAEEAVSACHDRILFSVFDMECKYLEEEISQGTLPKTETYSHIERMYHFHRLQEKAMEYLNLTHLRSGNRNTTEAESIETVLSFISSAHNTLSMPIEVNTITMFYPNVSKATEQDIQEAVKYIQDEKEKNMPNILIHYIQDKTFWRNFLYSKHKDFINRELAIFDDCMELLDSFRDKLTDEDYLSFVYIITEERKQAESSMYTALTYQFFVM